VVDPGPKPIGIPGGRSSSLSLLSYCRVGCSVFAIGKLCVLLTFRVCKTGKLCVLLLYTEHSGESTRARNVRLVVWKSDMDDNY